MAVLRNLPYYFDDLGADEARRILEESSQPNNKERYLVRRLAPNAPELQGNTYIGVRPLVCLERTKTTAEPTYDEAFFSLLLSREVRKAPYRVYLTAANIIRKTGAIAKQDRRAKSLVCTWKVKAGKVKREKPEEDNGEEAAEAAEPDEESDYEYDDSTYTSTFAYKEVRRVRTLKSLCASFVGMHCGSRVDQLPGLVPKEMVSFIRGF